MKKHPSKTEEIVEIDQLGHRGDGLVRSADEIVAVPYTLAGERVQIERTAGTGEAKLLQILNASPGRESPPCPHFTHCGGCHLQHLSSSLYRTFKRDLVISALHGQGLDALSVLDPVVFQSHTRRRAVFKVSKRHNTTRIGFYRRLSHEIIDLETCPLVEPMLEDLIGGLRLFLNTFLRPDTSLDVFATKSDVGLDVLFSFKNKPDLSLSDRECLIQFAADNDLARLSVTHQGRDGRSSDVIVSFRTPIIHFDGVPVLVAAHGFLQASKTMDDFVQDYINTSLSIQGKRVADLFCGRGTLSLPLSSKAMVDAFEMEGDALEALQAAAHKAQRPIRTTLRNLFQDPLKTKELEGYACVSINPPRVGAAKQMKELAHSTVPHVLMMSCNPQSFAKDARILIEGGYTPSPIIPIDQFLWSPPVEMIAIFSK
ncbi:MAG: class I SAM-dependent RNA methyltransferase [Candidatus Nucleicultricaceae bacterium]